MKPNLRCRYPPALPFLILSLFYFTNLCSAQCPMSPFPKVISSQQAGGITTVQSIDYSE